MEKNKKENLVKMIAKRLDSIRFLVGMAGKQGLGSRWVACCLMSVLALSTLAGCSSKSPEQLLEEGEMLIGTKQILEAEIKFQDYLEKYPDHEGASKAHFGLALCYMQDQDYELAREQLSQTIEAVGGLGDALGFQAATLKLYSYREEKNIKMALEEALATSTTLGTLEPDLRYTYNLMTAELYALNDMNEDAIALCGKLLEREDATSSILSSALQRLVQVHMRHEDIDSAIRVSEAYVQQHPDTPLKVNILSNIGFLYLRGSDKAAADQKLDEAEKMMASANQKLDEAEKLIQTNIDKALGEDEKSFGLVSLARLQRDRGRLEPMRQSLDTIIKEYPLSMYRSQAMLMRAELSLRSQQYEEAISMLENVAKDYANERPAAQAVQLIDQIRLQMQKPAGVLPSETVASVDADSATTATTATAATADETTTGPVAGDGTPGEAL